jgi:N-formylglutamate deformylase
MSSAAWQTEIGEGPLIACAIHDGHAVRPEVAERLRLDDAARRYEEDPHTAAWTALAPTRVIGLRSRFEVDLNRPRDTAVYLLPEDAWGLDVWRDIPPRDLIDRSLAEYDEFYAHWRLLLEQKLAQSRRVVVFDLHSYNHRRLGPAGPAADPEQNPEINIGTRTMDRNYWATIVDRFLADLRSFDYLGRRLNVRENVRFGGGQLAAWTHHVFPRSVCVLAIEVKKFYMDEWTGDLDATQFRWLGQALASAAAGVRNELEGGEPSPRPLHPG